MIYDVQRSSTAHMHTCISTNKDTFFAHRQPLLIAAGDLFSRSRLRGTQGGRVNATVRNWASAGLRGACSGRSKSRRTGSSVGSLSAEPEPSRATETHTKDDLQLFAYSPVYYSSHLGGRHATTAASLQGFYLVAATNDVFAGVSACVRVYAIGPTRVYGRMLKYGLGTQT